MRAGSDPSHGTAQNDMIVRCEGSDPITELNAGWQNDAEISRARMARFKK